MEAVGNSIKALFDLCFYGPAVLVLLIGIVVVPLKAPERTREENRRAIGWLVGGCVFWGGCAIIEAIKGALVLFLCLIPIGLLAIVISAIAGPILSALMACRAIDTWAKIDRAADDIHDMAERNQFRY